MAKSQTVTAIAAIVLDDVYYVLMLVCMCSMSFGVGTILGIAVSQP